MPVAYLALGSNLGDRADNLRRAGYTIDARSGLGYALVDAPRNTSEFSQLSQEKQALYTKYYKSQISAATTSVILVTSNLLTCLPVKRFLRKNSVATGTYFYHSRFPFR